MLKSSLSTHRTSLRAAAGGRRTAGVSLIEVLIVVLLFSFGLIGLVAIQARAAQFSVSAEDTGRAALLANELAAQMWAANTVNLPTATVTAWNARVANASAGGLPNGEGDVVITNNVARITIEWRPPHAAADAVNRYVTDILIPIPPAGSGT
ncbi:MAG: fimbrial assembly protein [Rubrivivax sp.]|nr:fimbrial assembly protein [Rubrivivax sp.]